MHPLARPKNRSGALGMKARDRVWSKSNGCYCTADEFLPDGDAYISSPEGGYATVKWSDLSPTAAQEAK